MSLSSTKPGTALIRMTFLTITYFFASALVMYCFVTRGGMAWGMFEEYSPSSFFQMVNWSAERPYVYRILLPSMVRLVDDLTPKDTKDYVNHHPLTRHPSLQLLRWNADHAYPKLVGLAIICCLFLGEGFMLRKLLALSYCFPRYVSDLSPLAGLLMLPAFFVYWPSFYDPMTLFAQTLGTLLVVWRKHVWLYFCLPFAALAKETSYLITGQFLVVEGTMMSRSKLVIHLASQILIWATLQGLLRYFFRNNPGDEYYFMLFRNLSWVTTWPMRHVMYVIVLLSFFGFLVCYRWKGKPLLLRRMLMFSLALFAPATLVFGAAFHEPRVWLELYPLVFLLAVRTVCDLFEVA